MPKEETHTEEAVKEINITFEEPTDAEAPQEEAPTEAEVQVEPEAEVQEAPEEAKLLDTVKAMQDEIDNLKQSQAPAPVAQPIVEDVVEDPGFDIGDPYQDNFKEKMEKYLTDRETKAAKKALEDVFGSARMQNLEMSHYSREHEISVAQSKENFGDRFDYKENGQDLMATQQKYTGLDVGSAHKLNDYDKLLNDYQLLKSGKAERANTQTPVVSGATRLVKKTDDGTVSITLTANQKAAADKYFGGDYQKMARAVDRQNNGGYI